MQRKYSDLVVKICLRILSTSLFLSIHLLSVWVLNEHRKKYSKLGPLKWYNYPSAQPETLEQLLRHVEKKCTNTIIKGIGSGGKTMKVQRKILLPKSFLNAKHEAK